MLFHELHNNDSRNVVVTDNLSTVQNKHFACVHACLVTHHALSNEVQLIALGLIAVGHANLSYVGFADVVARRTVLQVVGTKEVSLFLFV